jgi:hypothetical protein
MLFAKTTKLKSRSLGSPKIEDDNVNVMMGLCKRKKTKKLNFFPQLKMI